MKSRFRSWSFINVFLIYRNVIFNNKISLVQPYQMSFRVVKLRYKLFSKLKHISSDTFLYAFDYTDKYYCTNKIRSTKD